MLKTLCIDLKTEECPCSEASLVVCVVLFCVLYVTRAYSVCTKKLVGRSLLLWRKGHIKTYFPLGFIFVLCFCCCC